MTNQIPPYVGPYSAEFYDKLYGQNALFSEPIPVNLGQQDKEPRTFADRLDPTGWGRMDIMVTLALIISIAAIIFTLVKRK